MDSFIHLLDSTLRMNCDADHSEGGDIEEVPVISFSPSPENGLQSAGPVSGETLKDGATSELQIPQRELASSTSTLLLCELPSNSLQLCICFFLHLFFIVLGRVVELRVVSAKSIFMMSHSSHG